MPRVIRENFSQIERQEVDKVEKNQGYQGSQQKFSCSAVITL
jgi:hypothetical protein